MVSESGFPLVSAWPDESPWHVCRFNADYLSELTGALLDYALPWLWEGNESEQSGMVARIHLLVEQVTTAYECPEVEMAIPAGGVLAFAGDTLPEGFLWCDGDIISRTTYAGLFAAIGEAYGAGDGTTTFGIPDLRSHVPIGVGQYPGMTEYTLADEGGEEAHQLTVAELAAHKHYSGRSDLKSANGTYAGIPGDTIAYGSTVGGDTPHENRQPYLAVNFIIKT